MFLTKAAGWLSIALGAVHMAVALLDVRDTWSDVASEGWWNTFTIDTATTVAELWVIAASGVLLVVGARLRNRAMALPQPETSLSLPR